MVGVLHAFSDDIRCVRTIRDDVLDAMFGKAAIGTRRMIDHSLQLYQSAASAAKSCENMSGPILGIFAGDIRQTAASSISELLQTACLLYSSLGNLDKLDDGEESDAPQQDEVNKRFSSEVKTEVLKTRPDLATGFGKSSSIIPNGQKVKFGFVSNHALLHFTVLNPVRQGASIRDARARIFELGKAKELAQLRHASLIVAAPSDDDVTLGTRQREKLAENKREMRAEAESMNLCWHTVSNATEGAAKLILSVS